MATIEENKSLKVVAKLNNGTTATGQVKTASVSLGTLNMSRYSSNAGNDKAINIVNALGPCFSRSLYSVEKTQVSTISEE